MAPKTEKESCQDRPISADAQVARLVDVISRQFGGDTSAYFFSVAHHDNEGAPTEREDDCDR
jgi:hypothetical protein